ncbi:hypothetical protein M2436_007540 [Streptomyces sp. HB372]|nr:hypothetical protein [Streptomyces sp. HB372]
MNRLPHPSLLPAVPAPAPRPTVRRPLDLRVHAQRIQIDELIVTDPRQVLAHARTAAHADPDTAALLGYSTTTPLTLPAAAALLCTLHDPDELADMGLHMVRHTTRVTHPTPRPRRPGALRRSRAGPLMTARTLRQLRRLALRTLRRTPLVHQRRAPARHRPGCTPTCGERFLAQVPGPRTPEDR